MKIFINLLVIAGFGLALFITTRIFVMTNQEFHDDPGIFLYDRGSALPLVRAEILNQLEYFREGYLQRDTSILDSYMKQLFSTENILVLGTMPGEIYSGYTEAAELVSSDWLYWGDVNLLVESSNISATDSVAWFSMIGNVKFDLSSLLDLPLRVSGVMVRTGGSWKFQQLQFQFDLDTQWVFILIVLLALLLLVSIIRLIFVIVRARTRKRM
ncbi:MAG: nuclear transport factor 2 family protein [Bacteroidales bacterium]